jgi:predicted amidohydrolase
MREFFLALAQIHVQPGRKAENIANAIETIDLAARTDGSDVVLLPEALPLGWTHSSARNEAERIPEGEWCVALTKAARRNKVWICSGVIERDGDRIFNSAVLINADAFAKNQMISRTLGAMGAQVILSPCSWAVPADHDQQRDPYGQLWLDNYQPVAREFKMWIAGVSNVGPITDGPWRGRKCIGCSMAIGPQGEIAQRAPYGGVANTMVNVLIRPQERPRDWSGG